MGNSVVFDPNEHLASSEKVQFEKFKPDTREQLVGLFQSIMDANAQDSEGLYGLKLASLFTSATFAGPGAISRIKNNLSYIRQRQIEDMITYLRVSDPKAGTWFKSLQFKDNYFTKA